MDSLDLRTWEVYGDDHKGYSIGFKTAELERQLYCTTGIVTYSDAPFLYSFLREDDKVNILLYKKTKWDYEKEFCFVTVGIDIYTTRLRTVTPDTVAEVVIGYNIPKENEKDILDVVKQRYPAKLPVYKTDMNNQGQLTKHRIK